MNIANFAQIKAKSIQIRISVARTPNSTFNSYGNHRSKSSNLTGFYRNPTGNPRNFPNPLGVHRVFGGWPCRPSWHLDKAYRPEALEHLASERPGSPPSRCPGSHNSPWPLWLMVILIVDAKILSMVIHYG